MTTLFKVPKVPMAGKMPHTSQVVGGVPALPKIGHVPGQEVSPHGPHLAGPAAPIAPNLNGADAQHSGVGERLQAAGILGADRRTARQSLKVRALREAPII